MKYARLLTVTSVLSVFLFMVHLTHDIVLGKEQGELQDLIGGVTISVVWLAGAVMLAHRRSGHVIMLLGAILAAGVPALHMSGKGVGGAFARSPGAWFFIGTLMVMGVLGALSVILALHGLWSGRTPRD